MIGDHIRTLKAGCWNHAIDCGDETVIVLLEDAAQASRIRRSYRPEFVAGADTVEVVLHRERTFPAREVVARAYSRISDPALASMFRDSEAFATWCITGRLPAAAPDVATSAPGAAPPAPSAAASKPRPTPRPPARKAKAAAKTARKAKPARRAMPKRRASAARKPKPARRKAAKARARGPGRRTARRPAKRGGRR